MKKVLFFLIAIFVSLGFANAKEVYTLDWKNDQLPLGSVGTIRHMLPVDDGILVGGYDDDFHVTMIKLDKSGKEVKTLTLDYEGVVNGVYEYNGKYYFIATNDDESWNIYVYEIDNDLNVVRSKATGFYEEGSVEISNIIDDKVYITTIGIGGYSGFGVSDDDDYYDSYYIDLDDFSTGVGNNGDYSQFSKSQQALIYAFKMGHMMPTATYVGHGFTMVAGNQDPAGWGKGFVDVIQSDNLNKVFGIDYDGDYPENIEDFVSSRELMSPAWYSRIVETDDRVIAGGENYPYLDMYDFKGNYVDKIDIVNYLYGKTTSEMSSQLLDMVSKDGMLYVAYQYCDIDDNNCSVNCKSGVVAIKTRYNIEAKVTGGKGTVKVINVANSGDEITFEVVPEKGYVLDVVKVTDANGNVVTFTDYKFTMPSADVTIEVSFKKKSVIPIVPDIPINPETKAGITIIGLTILSVAALIITIKNGKKLRWLR